MTARIVRNPDGTNRSGNGKGVGLVTKPQTKKRGASKGKEAAEERAVPLRTLALNTSTYAGAEQVDPDKPLTEKQKLFVKYWAEGETILSASERAGYADGGTYAYRMVRMPNILKLYEREKKLYEEAAQMTRKKVMDMHLEAFEMAKLLSEPATMVAAAREVGKMCGYYEPVTKKIDVNITGNVIHQRLNKLSDAELLKMITSPVLEEVLNGNEDENEG